MLEVTHQPHEDKIKFQDFDVEGAAVRLLIAQIKYVRTRAVVTRLSQPGELREPTALLYHFNYIFDWLSAINRAGFDIPSRYSEEFCKVLEVYTRRG